jgi:chromosome partitioning protein
VADRNREGVTVAVITMLNQKGGVGKTSCTHHLAGTLAAMGRRVLLLDNDPQSSLSQGFWGPQAVRQIDHSETIANIYAGGRPFPEQVIRPTGIAGIDLVPGSRHASDFNVPRPYEVDPETQSCLRAFLDEAGAAYDMVILDCPPNLHLASWAALTASDYLIVPLQPEDYGAQGIVDVQESVEMVQVGPNPSLALLGFLLTMVAPRKTIHQLYEERLRALYGPAVFSAKVPEAVDYVEAIARRLPIASYKPKGAPAKAIRAVADEIESRISAMANPTTMQTEAA